MIAYDVDKKRLGTKALFDLKGPEAALSNWCGDHLPAFPDQPNTCTQEGETFLLLIGKLHWLLIAELSQEATLEKTLKPADAPSDISIVRVSDTQSFFQITGNDADQILSIASPLDVHRTVFPENGATFTEAFKLKALILRCPGGFWIAVEQSFGDMMDDSLTRAMS